MSRDQKLYRVFIASPGDLAAERTAMRETVERLNSIFAKETVWRIELLAWEDTLPGAGRPQELINADLDKADLFIGCVWHRWGTLSGLDSKTGFEEEFDRAMNRRAETGSPQLWLFFKDIDASHRADPGEQLRRVLAFRDRVTATKELLYRSFSDTGMWREIISDFLSRQMIRLVTDKDNGQQPKRDRNEEPQTATTVSAREQVQLPVKFLPGTLVLGPNESPPRQLPVIVRDLIGQVRRTHETRKIAASEGQPFRIRAGTIDETGGIWVYWEDVSDEMQNAAARERADQRRRFRELALALRCEKAKNLPVINALDELVRVMLTVDDVAPIDVRDLAERIGHTLGISIRTVPDPVVVVCSRDLMEFALRTIFKGVAENRADGLRNLMISVRSSGMGSELTALVSVMGKNLVLPGILPDVAGDSDVSQSDLAILISKEIIRIHRGEIHAGPGIRGTEILISFRHA